MLGKLIKHEFKALNRYYIPLNLAVIVATIIGKIFISLNISKQTPTAIIGLLIFAYVALLVIAAVSTQILYVVHFYRNLFTDEGYLMNTLPVKPWQHIAAKGIVAWLWSQINLFLVIISIPFLVITNTDALRLIHEAWQELTYYFDSVFNRSMISFLLLLLLTYIVASIASILKIYVSIAVGQLSSKHKVLSSFACYFGIMIVLQILSTIVSFATAASWIVSSSTVTETSMMLTTNSSLFFSLAMNVAVSIGAFFITNYLMTKKLNLE